MSAAGFAPTEWGVLVPAGKRLPQEVVPLPSHTEAQAAARDHGYPLVCRQVGPWVTVEPPTERAMQHLTEAARAHYASPHPEDCPLCPVGQPVIPARNEATR